LLSFSYDIVAVVLLQQNPNCCWWACIAEDEKVSKICYLFRRKEIKMIVVLAATIRTTETRLTSTNAQETKHTCASLQIELTFTLKILEYGKQICKFKS